MKRQSVKHRTQAMKQLPSGQNLSQKPADIEVHDCLRRQDHLKMDQWVNVCNVMCF